MLEQLIQSKVTANFVPYFLLAIAIEMIVIRVFAVKGTKDLKDDGVSVFYGVNVGYHQWADRVSHRIRFVLGRAIWPV